MIDKSVPYVPIIMKREPGQPLPVCGLAPGYRYVYYSPGDEHAWAAIETSVNEFNYEADALGYFNKEFMPYQDELARRMLFAETTNGKKIGTASIWWRYTGKRRHPILHWIAVKPEHQNKGLGKALVAETVRLSCEIEGDIPIYLSTQTWSHKAVRIYEWAGFTINDEPGALGNPNDRVAEAIEVLSLINR